jgi:hypothetical protein
MFVSATFYVSCRGTSNYYFYNGYRNLGGNISIGGKQDNTFSYLTDIHVDQWV